MKPFLKPVLLSCLLSLFVFGDWAIGQFGTPHPPGNVPVPAGRDQRIAPRRDYRPPDRNDQIQTIPYQPQSQRPTLPQVQPQPSVDETAQRLLESTEIRCIAYTYNGSSASVNGDGTVSISESSSAYVNRNGTISISASLIPKTFISWVEKFESEGKKIKSVAFTKNGGYAIIWGKNGYRYWNIPSGLVKRIKEAVEKEHAILSAAIGKYDQWVLLTDEKMFWSDNCSVHLKEKMNAEVQNGAQISMVGFNSSNGWVMQYRKNGSTNYWFVDPTSEQKEAFLDNR